MSNVALPGRRGASEHGLFAILRHARYILGENAVTAFAFALFMLIVLAALIGPYVVPYDPLASDTAARSSRLRSHTGAAPISSAATCSAA